MSALLTGMSPKPPHTSTSGVLSEIALTAIVLVGAVIGATLLVRAVVRGYDAVLNALASR